MDHRTFTDRNGLSWTVSEVKRGLLTLERRERHRETRPGASPPNAGRFATRPLHLPWLCFESRCESRALTPVPAGWGALPESDLEDLLGESAILNIG